MGPHHRLRQWVFNPKTTEAIREEVMKSILYFRQRTLAHLFVSNTVETFTEIDYALAQQRKLKFQRIYRLYSQTATK